MKLGKLNCVKPTQAEPAQIVIGTLAACSVLDVLGTLRFGSRCRAVPRSTGALQSWRTRLARGPEARRPAASGWLIDTFERISHTGVS